MEWRKRDETSAALELVVHTLETDRWDQSLRVVHTCNILVGVGQWFRNTRRA